MVRRWYPKRCAGALHLKIQIAIEKEIINDLSFVAYFLDDRSDVRKALLVLCTWPTISANHAVKLRMGPGLDIWA